MKMLLRGRAIFSVINGIRNAPETVKQDVNFPLNVSTVCNLLGEEIQKKVAFPFSGVRWKIRKRDIFYRDKDVRPWDNGLPYVKSSQG